MAASLRAMFPRFDSRTSPSNGSRKNFSRWNLAIGLMVASAVACSSTVLTAAPPKFRVYFGTYSSRGSKGIYVADLDLANGSLSTPQVAGEVTSPSFLAIHPSRKYLVSVNEISDLDGKKTGGLTSFAIQADGTLKKLNQQSSGGAGPCHVVVDAAGTHALVANYGGGSAAVLPIGEDGNLGPASSLVQHQGSSVNKQRQEAPHAHSINLDAANRFAFVADLGLDQVLIYRYDAAKGLLSPNDPPHAKVAAGAGPRHFAMHPNGRFAYVINEMASTVTAFGYDAARGSLNELQTISTLPPGYTGNTSTAEVQVHPSGKFLFGSNRGHNTIVSFKIGDDGKLAYVAHQGQDVNVPRNFGVDPTGKYVLVGSQESDRVVVFQVDLESGKLLPTGNSVAVPIPVCVKFLTLD